LPFWLCPHAHMHLQRQILLYIEYTNTIERTLVISVISICLCWLSWWVGNKCFYWECAWRVQRFVKGMLRCCVIGQGWCPLEKSLHLCFLWVPTLSSCWIKQSTANLSPIDFGRCLLDQMGRPFVLSWKMIVRGCS
jgi:hypothetical protein